MSCCSNGSSGSSFANITHGDVYNAKITAELQRHFKKTKSRNVFDTLMKIDKLIGANISALPNAQTVQAAANWMIRTIMMRVYYHITYRSGAVERNSYPYQTIIAISNQLSKKDTSAWTSTKWASAIDEQLNVVSRVHTVNMNRGDHPRNNAIRHNKYVGHCNGRNAGRRFAFNALSKNTHGWTKIFKSAKREVDRLVGRP